jgi:hypothetical protein
MWGEGEGGSPELPFLAELQAVRNDEPALYQEIQALPPKARCAYTNGHPAGLVTFFRKGGQKLFFHGTATEALGAPLPFPEAATRMKANADLPSRTLPSEAYFDLLDRNKAALRELLAPEAAPAMAQARTRGTTSHATKAQSLVTTFITHHKDALTATQKDYLQQQVKQLRDGATSKGVAKRAVDVLGNETNFLDLSLAWPQLKSILGDTTGAARPTPEHNKPTEVILSALLMQ